MINWKLIGRRGWGGVDDHDFLAKLRYHGQNSQSKFYDEHLYNFRFFVVEIVEIS
jgi:hypothetical protein